MAMSRVLFGKANDEVDEDIESADNSKENITTL